MEKAFDIDSFDWESQDQKKCFMNLFQYLRRYGIDPRHQDIPARLLATYLIQKDLESNEWWLQLLTTQMDPLVEEMRNLHARIECLELAATPTVGDNEESILPSEV